MPPKGWKKGDGPICLECWPGGWPENSGSASCSHGDWSRTVPAPVVHKLDLSTEVVSEAVAEVITKLEEEA
jgi:hypothetical protein